MNLAAEAVNRTLERETWARERLAAHAGRTVRFVVGPARATFAIDTDGRLHAAVATPDLTLSVSPLRLPALLAQPGRWTELVSADGDAALVATLADLALTLPMFVEQAFARAFGPIVGQQFADAGRRLLVMPEYSAQRVGDSIARFVGDEGNIAVPGAQGRAFAADVATLASEVDALATRIDALANNASREHDT
ncbi:MAG: SCP2 sterol-binding domain-containing protein [Casimicrobiaceae bacterium]